MFEKCKMIVKFMKIIIVWAGFVGLFGLQGGTERANIHTEEVVSHVCILSHRVTTRELYILHFSTVENGVIDRSQLFFDKKQFDIFRPFFFNRKGAVFVEKYH